MHTHSSRGKRRHRNTTEETNTRTHTHEQHVSLYLDGEEAFLLVVFPAAGDGRCRHLNGVQNLPEEAWPQAVYYVPVSPARFGGEHVPASSIGSRMLRNRRGIDAAPHVPLGRREPRLHLGPLVRERL